MYTYVMLKKMGMIGLICLMTSSVLAGDGLSTRDKSCRFYYMTQKNTQGWYIDVSPEMCKNGVVQGQGEITIYNAFGKPDEQIYGFFNAGFWTGDKPLSADILGQTTEPDGTQKVFFLIPNNSQIPVDFIGQMTSMKQKDASYTPFSFCNPFRILVKTTDVTLFQEQQKTTKLVNDVVKKIRTFCPAEQTIMLYAAMVDNPTPTDIFFYASIDLQTARIDVKKNTAFDVNLSALPPPLEGINDAVPVVEVPQLPDDLSDLNVLNKNALSDVKGDATIVPVPKTDELSVLLPQEIPALLDKVPHLLMAAKVLKKPVLGAAIVHVKSVQGTAGIADMPSRLTLMGDGLTEGWGVVSGTFTSSIGTGAQQVQVSSFVPCLQERCQELEGKNE